MTTIDLEGKVIIIGAPYMLPGTDRAAQKIILEVTYNDARKKNDLFAVFLYGKDTEVNGPVWAGYNPSGSKMAFVRCKLGGRYKNSRDTLTLTLKKIQWL